MYTVTLSDGTKLENLKLNGNNYISEMLIEDVVFEDNLSQVTITNLDDGTTEEHTDMKLIQNKVYGTESWFILAEKTQEELEKEEFRQLLADLAETVLMGGVV